MKLAELYNRITALEVYAPSKEVNGLFSALVAEAIDPLGEEMLSKKQCGCLQKICAHAEYELEMHWAKQIIDGVEQLVDFPYYKNYKDLARLEWNAVASCSEHDHHKVLFVGSGPLPMTAIMLALNHGVSSTLVDNDQAAVDISQALIKTLGLGHMITIVCADGNSFDRYQDFNVIFVAALAGQNVSQKISIFTHIKKAASEHCHVLARSSWGRRQLLYPPLPKKVWTLFKPLIEISPYNEIVNSVVIFKSEKKVWGGKIVPLSSLPATDR